MRYIYRYKAVFLAFIISVGIGHIAHAKIQMASITTIEEQNAASPSQLGIMEAARHGNLRFIKQIVSSGKYNINTRGLFKETMLHWAAGTSNINLMAYLINGGVEINALDSNGQTALYWASNSGTDAAIKYLIEKGIDPNVKDKEGLTALDMAKEKKSHFVVALLEPVTLDSKKAEKKEGEEAAAPNEEAHKGLSATSPQTQGNSRELTAE